MTTAHDTFTISRHHNAQPETVFRHWAEPELKRAWFAENDGPEWKMLDHGLDFRVGGREHGRWEMAAHDDLAAPATLCNETRYFEITRMHASSLPIPWTGKAASCPSRW